MNLLIEQKRSYLNWFNHTISVVVVTSTHRPELVRNICVIEVFCGVFSDLFPFLFLPVLFLCKK